MEQNLPIVFLGLGSLKIPLELTGDLGGEAGLRTIPCPLWLGPCFLSEGCPEVSTRFRTENPEGGISVESQRQRGGVFCGGGDV